MTNLIKEKEGLERVRNISWRGDIYEIRIYDVMRKFFYPKITGHSVPSLARGFYCFL